MLKQYKYTGREEDVVEERRKRGDLCTNEQGVEMIKSTNLQAATEEDVGGSRRRIDVGE